MNWPTTTRRGACGAECFDDAATPDVQLHGLANITSIAAGYAFGDAVNNSGNVLAWGWNNLGVFGNGTCGATSTFDPTSALVSAAVARRPSFQAR